MSSTSRYKIRKLSLCHSERGRKSDEESLLLCKYEFLPRCAGVTFFEESNQRRGGCDPPTPQRCTSVECYGCYKSRKFETSHKCSLDKFLRDLRNLHSTCYALECKLLSASYAIIIRGTFLEPLCRGGYQPPVNCPINYNLPGKLKSTLSKLYSVD